MNKAAQQTRKDSADTKNDVKTQNVFPIRNDSDNDPLAHFKGEDEAAAPPPSKPPPVRRAPPKKVMTGVIAAAVIAGVAVAAIVYARQRVNQTVPAARPAASERARLNSRPEGASVTVDGVARGVTPVELTLPPGPHDVVLRNDAGERRL